MPQTQANLLAARSSRALGSNLNQNIMKNMKNLSTQTEVKIAAAEFFIKYMLEIYHQEVKERNKEADKTADMIWRVETYLEILESNRF